MHTQHTHTRTDARTCTHNMHTHAIDPNSAVPFTTRGFAKFSVDECSSAIEDHNEAIRIDPKFSAMSLLLYYYYYYYSYLLILLLY